MTTYETLTLVSYFFVLSILAVYGWHRYFIVYQYMRNKDRVPGPPPEMDEWPVVTVQLPIFNERTVAASGSRNGTSAPSPLQARQPSGLTAEQQRFNPNYKPGTTTYGVMRHVVTNIDITVQGNTAKGDYYVLTYGNNPEARRPELVSVARNEDTFIKRNGHWLIQSTKLNYDWGNDEMARLMKLGPYSPGLEPPSAQPVPPMPTAPGR